MRKRANQSARFDSRVGLVMLLSQLNQKSCGRKRGGQTFCPAGGSVAGYPGAWLPRRGGVCHASALRAEGKEKEKEQEKKREGKGSRKEK